MSINHTFKNGVNVEKRKHVIKGNTQYVKLLVRCHLSVLNTEQTIMSITN